MYILWLLSRAFFLLSWKLFSNIVCLSSQLYEGHFAAYTDCTLYRFLYLLCPAKACDSSRIPWIWNQCVTAISITVVQGNFQKALRHHKSTEKYEDQKKKTKLQMLHRIFKPPSFIKNAFSMLNRFSTLSPCESFQFILEIMSSRVQIICCN